MICPLTEYSVTVKNYIGCAICADTARVPRHIVTYKIQGAL